MAPNLCGMLRHHMHVNSGGLSTDGTATRLVVYWVSYYVLRPTQQGALPPLRKSKVSHQKSDCRVTCILTFSYVFEKSHPSPQKASRIIADF